MSKANLATDKADKKPHNLLINKISSIVIGAIFILVTIALLSLVVQSSGGKKPSIFGYRLYFVLTDSMEPTLEVNDVLLSEIMSAEEVEDKVKEGDIITFVAEYGMQSGMTITHRVVKGVYFDETYQRYMLQTKGDNEKASIDPPVPVENVRAKMVKTVSGISKLYKSLTSTMGLLLILIIPCIFVLGALIYRLVIIIKTPPQSNEDKNKKDSDVINQIKLKAVEEYKQKRSKEIAEKAVRDYIEQQKKQ